MLKLTQLSGLGGTSRPTDFDLSIDASAADVDLHSFLTARGYRNEPEVAVDIRAGVQVHSTTTAAPGLLVDLADFPRNCRIDLTIHGEICGRGGASVPPAAARWRSGPATAQRSPSTTAARSTAAGAAARAGPAVPARA